MRQLPPMTKFNLTLTIPVSINIENLDGVKIDQISKHLSYDLENWNDGRYPLEVELLSHAANRLLKSAISKAIEDVHAEKYPGYFEYENGCVVKWAMTSKKIIRRIMHFFTGTWSGSIQ